MLWVEQPVGTGFSQGKRNAHNEIGISRDFVGFYKNWQKVFGISNYKTYVTGESYAGRYVPYIAAEMLNQKDETYFDVGGALVYDPVIGSFDLVGMNIPTYDFVKANDLILNLNQTFLDQLKKVNDKCGWTQIPTSLTRIVVEHWMQEYLQFPPPGNQPHVSRFEPNASCGTQAMAYEAIYTVNPCFNVYHITDVCPFVEDWLLYQRPYTTQPYFNRTDAREALPAPPAKCFHDW